MQLPDITIISALSQNNVIGLNNALPWHISEEYEHYLSIVKGNIVIMGSVSYAIFGRDISDSEVIVLSRTKTYSEKNVHVCNSLENVLQMLKGASEKVFCAGGASVYTAMLPYTNTLYLSYIKGEYEGDTYFPQVKDNEWQCMTTKEHKEFDFKIYERQRRKNV